MQSRTLAEMSLLRTLHVTLCVVTISTSHEDVCTLEQQEISLLSDLPLNKILLVQRSVNNSDGSDLPIALPLRELPRNPLQHMQIKGLHKLPIKRGHEEEEYIEWMPKAESGKFSQIFEKSITILSFLAFGGYLLCIIVHAIKDHKNTPAAAAISAEPILIYPGPQQLARPTIPPTRFPILLTNVGRKKRQLNEPYRFYTKLHEDNSTVKTEVDRTVTESTEQRRVNTRLNEDNSTARIDKTKLTEVNTKPDNGQSNENEVDRMFDVLLRFSEGFVRFNQFFDF